MAEGKWFKLNLSSIKKSKDVWKKDEESKVDAIKTQNESNLKESENSNLPNISSQSLEDKTEQKIQETSNIESDLSSKQETKINKTQNDIALPNNNISEIKDNQTPNIKNDKIDFEKKEETHWTNSEILEKEESNIKSDKLDIEKKEENSLEEEKDLFVNYKSDFNSEKKEDSWEQEKPKKNEKWWSKMFFFLSFVLFSVIWIAIFFFTKPDIHNLDNYKNNLLEAKKDLECLIDSKKCVSENDLKDSILKDDENSSKSGNIEENTDFNENQSIEENKNTQEEVVEDTEIEQILEQDENIDFEEKSSTGETDIENLTWEKIEETTINTIKRWTFTIDYELKTLDWKETILYKDKEYETIEDFNNFIEQEIKNEKINKLKNYIINQNN